MPSDSAPFMWSPLRGLVLTGVIIDGYVKHVGRMEQAY